MARPGGRVSYVKVAGRIALGSLAKLAFVTLWVLALAHAQVSYDTATLKGTIFDPSASALAVPNAAISITNPATGVTRSTKSTDTGTYQFPELPPGTYNLTIEAAGFNKAVADNIVLTVGQVLLYDIHLIVGNFAQAIDVKDRPLTIDPEQTQQANTVTQYQVENLPNVGRRFLDLIYTVPGVSNSYAPTVQDPSIGTGLLSSGFSIGGSNGRNNLVTIDGGENDYGSGAPRVRNVPLDSVQEFQVNRNAFGAEFGSTIGTAINFITKSGTNTYHGSASGYFHNEGLDSVDYFNQLIAPGTRPFEQSVIFGGTLGGPIKRDKLFFFTAYEHQKLDSATSQNYTGTSEFQPISAQTSGYSGGTCPGQPQQQVSQLCYLTQLANSGTPLAPLGAALLASPVFGSPLANPVLKALVLPNQGTFDGIISPLGAVRGIPGYNTPRGRYNNWVSRIDYMPTGKDSVMFRFSLMYENDNVAPQPPASTFDHRTDYTLTSAWTHSFSPSFVNVFRTQVVPRDTATAGSPQPGGSEIDLLTGSSIVLGNPFSMPYDADFKRFQFDDNLFLQKSGHAVKFGISYRPNNYSVSEQLWFGGQWQFEDGAIPLLALAPSAFQGALAAYNVSQGYSAAGPASTNLTAAQSFIAGTPVALLQANPNSNTRWAAWDHSLGFYVQDAWKVSPRLTVNYGARLDYDAAPTPVPHSIYASPRAGVAWNPAGDGKTVIRAGGGLYVAPVQFMVPFYVNVVGDSGHYINQGALSAGLPSPPFPSIFAAWAVAEAKATAANPNPALNTTDLASIGWAINPPGPTAFGSVFSTLAPNFKPEYSIQASLSVAREIARNLSVEAGYDLYRSVHVEQVVEGNFQQAPCNAVNPAQFTAAIDPFVGPCYVPKPGTTAGVPNSLVFQNNVWSSIGTGIYHGFTASVAKNYDNGLQFQVHYTLSRARDDTSDFSTLDVPFRPDQLNKDWGISDFNVTHNFVANAVYTTPFKAGGSGWSKVFAGIVISPIFYARSGIPFTLLVPGLGGPGGNGTIGHTSEARPWNEPRNEGRGDAFVSWDMRVSKSFYLERSKGMRVDLIVQVQNLLNRTNFAAVNNIFPANPSFTLPNGGNLLNGPWNVQGFAPTSVSQLGQPLAFTSANPPRIVSFGLKFAF
ncbi:MAG TPA: carboxypeptidase regulatory-like domain-containing protein [Bryobacteraceae bacterium]|nr:carboxypeptidase regulatory-like domain-containing protein [Bryobacteraceae bacterium]